MCCNKLLLLVSNTVLSPAINFTPLFQEKMYQDLGLCTAISEILCTFRNIEYSEIFTFVNMALGSIHTEFAVYIRGIRWENFGTSGAYSVQNY